MIKNLQKTPETNYFEWLCINVGGVKNYSKLLKILFDTEYYWSVELDGDRAKDGLALRKMFTEFFGYNELKLGKCNVLEMLVALAMSCEDNIMHDNKLGDRTYVWFWLMLDNLGITGTRFTDKFMDNGAELIVRQKVKFMLDRRYKNDGVGSLFKCVNFVPNFAKLDIWKQLTNFMTEKLERDGIL